MPYYLKYGDRQFEVRLPDEQIKLVLEPNTVELPSRTPRELIEDALDNPIGTGRIEDMVKSGDKICIVISDKTRSWQNPGMILGVLLERLNGAGIRDKDIVIISARGTHRAQTDDELRALVTDEIFSRVRVVDHDPSDESNLTYLGTTSRGTPVKLQFHRCGKRPRDTCRRGAPPFPCGFQRRQEECDPRDRIQRNRTGKSRAFSEPRTWQRR